MSTILSTRVAPEPVDEKHIPVSVLIRSLSPIQRLHVRVSALSLFEDDFWDFSVEIPTLGPERTIIRFDIAVSPVAKLTTGGFAALVDSIKCLAYSLRFDPPRTDMSLGTIAKAFKKGHGIGNLYWFLANRGIERVSDLTEEHFFDMQNYFKKQPIANDIERPITNQTLVGRFHGVDWIYQQGGKLEDRLTFDPWAQDGTCGRWARKNAEVVVPRSSLSTQPWSDQLTRSLIQASLIELGRAQELLSAFVAKRTEESDAKPLEAQIEKNAWDSQDTGSLKAEYVRLRSSVALLIGCLSGMRCSELLSVAGDPEVCCSVRKERLGDRFVSGYFIAATLRKYQPVPKTEEWQTIPIVHNAVLSLTAVNEVVANQDTPFLFRTCSKQKPSTRGRELRGHTLVVGLNLLANHHNVDLSEVNGRIAAMDLRRTFARLVTRSGLGLIELQSQLKHRDPDLSMKYGAPSIREYLTEEKENWTRDQYDELLRGDEKLIGGGAKEIVEMRKRFAGLTRLEKEAFLIALPKQALIDQVGDGLCMYRAERALCGGEKISCRPADCGNSVIRADEIGKTLQFRKQENERLLKIFSKQPAKREHLKVQLATVIKLLGQACAKAAGSSDA